MAQVKVRKAKITELVQDDRNLNKGTARGKELIEKSIGQFGAVRGVAVDKDNRIIAGNKTVENAIEQGVEEIIIVETTGKELVVTKRVDTSLDTKEGREMALADNATVKADLAWDLDAMNEVASDFEIDTDSWLSEFPQDENLPEELQGPTGEKQGEGEGKPQAEVKEDDFDPDAHYETKVKAGEVWQLGEHRLMCGDSTDADAVAKLMNGERADLVFTDPPYGYKYESNKPRQGGKNYDMIMNDDKILDFFPVVIPHCSGWIFVCTTWKVLDIWMPLFKKYLELTNMVVWDKGGGGMGDLKKTFYTDHEIILTANQGNEFYGNRIGSVWNFQTDVPSSYLHPTQKPVKLSACAIEKTTREGEIVLDVFGGSGSTMIACEQLGRKCRMMELDPHYCTVIISRWEQHTGQKAVKL